MQTDEKELIDRIEALFPELPRGERKLAELLLALKEDLGRYSASELAEEAGVSKATVARFFKRLGYSNFRAARRETRAATQQVQQSKQQIAERVVAKNISQDINLHLESDIQNLRYTFETSRADTLRTVISALATSDKLWVVGFDDDYALAHLARSLLIRIKPDIRMLPLGGFSVPEEFASITPRDVILGFGIRRRPSSLMKVIHSGLDAGARVVLVTDESSGNLAPIHWILRCRTRGAFLFDSVCGPLSLITFICSGVAAILGEPAVERLHRIESIHDSWGDARTT